MIYEVIANYLRINTKFNSLSEFDFESEVECRQEIIEQRFSENQDNQVVFLETIKLLTSALFMNDELLEQLLILPATSFERLNNILNILVNNNLLSRQSLRLTLEYFKNDPAKMYDMVVFLNDTERLSDATLTTALSKQANELFWVHVRDVQTRRVFIQKLLSSCDFLYENEVLFIHALETVAAMIKASPRNNLMALDNAFNTLHEKDLLTYETISMLVATEEKYKAKAEGIIFLSERSLLAAASGPDVYYGKFGQDHLELMKLLDKQCLLNKALVKLILKVRNKKKSYSIFDIDNIMYVYKQSLKNVFNIPTKVIHQLLSLDDFRTCSFLQVIKIVNRSFQLNVDDWQRLESEYAKLFTPKTIKHNRDAYDCLMKIWETLQAKRYDSPQVRAWMLEGQMRIFSKKQEWTRLEKRDLLNSILAMDIKFNQETLKALLLSTRLENIDNIEHPLNFLYNQSQGIRRIDLSPIVTDDILRNHFFESYLMHEECNEDNFKKAMDIYEHFKLHAPTMLQNRQRLQNIISTENLQQIPKIIQSYIRMRDLEQLFDDILTYRDNFVDNEGDLLNGFGFIPHGRFISLEHWQVILTICRDETLQLTQKRDAISLNIQNFYRNDAPYRVIRQNAAQGLQPQATVNDRQSTHTASVHIGTNITLWVMGLLGSTALLGEGLKDSIKSLHSRTQNMIAQCTANQLTQQQYYQIRGLMSLLSISNRMMIKVSADEKKRCLALIEKENLWEGEPLRDELKKSVGSSKTLSMGQFLTYIYHHIMTNKPLNVSDDDVFNAFLKLGYETLRGYNLDDRGIDIDLHAPSRRMCTSGSFNKACEILSAFSNKILFYFISDSSIMLKAKCILLEKISSDYDNLCSDDRKKMMDNLEGDDPGSVFEAFLKTHKNEITKKLKDEFDSFKDSAEIEKVLVGFEKNVVPFFPSPMMDNAQDSLTSSFVDWFKTKKSEITETTEIDNILSPVSFSGSLFHQHGDNTKRSISEIDSQELQEEEKEEEKEEHQTKRARR